jgi:hypothetical protein
MLLIAPVLYSIWLAIGFSLSILIAIMMPNSNALYRSEG